VKPIVSILFCLGVVASAWAQTPAAAASPTVRHVIGMEMEKRNANGVLTVEAGTLRFKSAKADSKVAVSSIDDILIGTETTQSGGKTGRAVKTAAIAAPYGSGKALTILMRTKVDILTVSYHDTDGAVHGAIFALPIGQAASMRAQLVQAGAHASPDDSPAVAGSKP
jgi:hypothetical protein